MTKFFIGLYNYFEQHKLLFYLSLSLSILLMGFFAEADGEETIRLDQTELAEAVWCDAAQIPEDDGVSLTREMMQVFKAHVNKKLEFHK